MTNDRTRPPNFIVILCDDLGYGDISLDGSGPIRTPSIAKMASEGVYLSDYYAPANICTPSRAGLLTGRYPVRTGLGYEVIMQNDDRGLSLSEITIAQALKPGGYTSALFGKWHLGHQGPAWPPTNHGFDEFFGIPYSHDMAPLALFEAFAGRDEVTTSPVNFHRLQQDFYARTEAFVTANHKRPFFVELALSAPHLPEYPNPPFETSTLAGPYGAVVQEIDDIVGRLLTKLRELALEKDTVVVFTSDNGPWFEGSTGGLRERKGGGGYDGGYRVPFVAWGPGRIPPGRKCSSIAMGIDLLPTFVAMAGLDSPPGAALDGRDISDVLIHDAASPHEALILFDNDAPIGVRTQRWKYLSAVYYRAMKLPYSIFGYEELHDLIADPSESYSVAATHPEVTAAMRERLSAAKMEFAPYRQKEIPAAFRSLRSRGAHPQD